MIRPLLAAGLLAAASASGAAAAEGGRIGVEFNDLQQAEGGCRAVFVLNNGLGKPVDKLTLRVVSFDTEGHARLFLSLDVGPLPVGKTRVLRFDLGEKVACAEVGRFVLDDVITCTGGDLTPAGCLAAIALSARTSVKFDF